MLHERGGEVSLKIAILQPFFFQLHRRLDLTRL